MCFIDDKAPDCEPEGKVLQLNEGDEISSHIGYQFTRGKYIPIWVTGNRTRIRIDRMPVLQLKNLVRFLQRKLIEKDVTPDTVTWISIINDEIARRAGK